MTALRVGIAGYGVVGRRRHQCQQQRGEPENGHAGEAYSGDQAS